MLKFQKDSEDVFTVKDTGAIESAGEILGGGVGAVSPGHLKVSIEVEPAPLLGSASSEDGTDVRLKGQLIPSQTRLPSTGLRFTHLLPRSIIVPAYFYPDLDQADSRWERLALEAGKLGKQLVIVANPGNGPGTQSDAKYVQAIGRVREAGAAVIGYVHTCWANGFGEAEPLEDRCERSEESVRDHIDDWYEWYDIDGIFFDEVDAKTENVHWYQGLFDHVQEKGTGALVVNNFGVVPHGDYFEIGSSVLCVFENYLTELSQWSPPVWPTSGSRERFLVLVHHASTSSELQAAFAQLRRQRIGCVYLTGEWTELPGFFEELVDLVKGGTPLAQLDGDGNLHVAGELV